MADKPLSLSGAWTGVYDYASPDIDAVPFSATLTDIAGVIWGDTQEPNTFSPSTAQHLTASLSGVRTVREVSFRKEYDNVIAGEEIVHYVGEVSQNGQRIQGEWRILIPGKLFSGPFVMNRQKGLAQDRALEMLFEESLSR